MATLFSEEILSLVDPESVKTTHPEECIEGGVSALIYDVEIVRAIPNRNEPMLPDIEYCNGWTDYLGMGVAVIGCYDYMTGELNAYGAEELEDFAYLVSQRKHIIGFNSKRFDDPLLRAHGVDITTTYDVLEVLKSHCQPLLGKGKFIYKLDAFTNCNGMLAKSMQGGEAPILWQRGAREDVIDYCKGDAFRLKQLLDADEIIEPNRGLRVRIPKPF